MEITTKVNVPADKIASLLCSAFDPACNAVSYWCEVVKYEKPLEVRWQDSPKQVYPYMDYPLNPEGAIVLKDIEDDDKEYRLSLTEITSGLQTMLEKHPKHFADILSDNADNSTADVFVQHCLFGEVKYS